MAERSARDDRRRELERKAWHHPCPKCGASPGEACTTESGGRAAIHRERIRQAAFVPLEGPE
jgi:hypothetical protein